jgi:hypothetical protein
MSCATAFDAPLPLQIRGHKQQLHYVHSKVKQLDRYGLQELWCTGTAVKDTPLAERVTWKQRIWEKHQQLKPSRIVSVILSFLTTTSSYPQETELLLCDLFFWRMTTTYFQRVPKQLRKHVQTDLNMDLLWLPQLWHINCVTKQRNTTVESQRSLQQTEKRMAREREAGVAARYQTYLRYQQATDQFRVQRATQRMTLLEHAYQQPYKELQLLIDTARLTEPLSLQLTPEHWHLLCEAASGVSVHDVVGVWRQITEWVSHRYALPQFGFYLSSCISTWTGAPAVSPQRHAALLQGVLRAVCMSLVLLTDPAVVFKTEHILPICAVCVVQQVELVVTEDTATSHIRLVDLLPLMPTTRLSELLSWRSWIEVRCQDLAQFYTAVPDPVADLSLWCERAIHTPTYNFGLDLRYTNTGEEISDAAWAWFDQQVLLPVLLPFHEEHMAADWLRSLCGCERDLEDLCVSDNECEILTDEEEEEHMEDGSEHEEVQRLLSVGVNAAVLGTKIERPFIWYARRQLITHCTTAFLQPLESYIHEHLYRKMSQDPLTSWTQHRHEWCQLVQALNVKLHEEETVFYESGKTLFLWPTSMTTWLQATLLKHPITITTREGVTAMHHAQTCAGDALFGHMELWLQRERLSSLIQSQIQTQWLRVQAQGQTDQKIHIEAIARFYVECNVRSTD